MSDTTLFKDNRADLGLLQTIEWDDSANTFSIVTRCEDVQPTLDMNAIKRSHGRDYYARDPGMWRVASIPIGVQLEWMTKFGVVFDKPEHLPAVKRLLNSNEYRYLKTADIII